MFDDDAPDDAFRIPEEFWSEYSEQPFVACIECETPLNQAGMPYAIQKHVVAGEGVFEMAICIDCASRLNQQFSAQSRESLMDFVRGAPERRRRQEQALEEGLCLSAIEDVATQLQRNAQRSAVRREEAMSSCAICAKPRTDCHRYSLGTACVGLMLVIAPPEPESLGSPFLICEDCELQLNECVSRQTRDAWDRFVDEHFDGPPGLVVDPHELVGMF